MSIAIRPAVEADIPAVAAIYDAAVAAGTATFETVPPGAAEMARRFAVLRAGGYPYLVAVGGGAMADRSIGDEGNGDGVVAGYAYAGPYHQRAAYRSTVEDSIYVAEGARGGGIGRALLAALIAEGEAIDARLMVAVIADSGSPASVRLHESLGFTRVGALAGVGYKHGRWLDTTLMQRPLGPGRDRPPTRV